MPRTVYFGRAAQGFIRATQKRAKARTPLVRGLVYRARIAWLRARYRRPKASYYGKPRWYQRGRRNKS